MSGDIGIITSDSTELLDMVIRACGGQPKVIFHDTTPEAAAMAEAACRHLEKLQLQVIPLPELLPPEELPSTGSAVQQEWFWKNMETLVMEARVPGTELVLMFAKTQHFAWQMQQNSNSFICKVVGSPNGVVNALAGSSIAVVRMGQVSQRQFMLKIFHAT